MTDDDVLDAHPLLFLVGTTASGKSRLGLELAERLDAEIVSLDSMSVYRGMDVGTAKPSPAERERVPHHLIDVADPRDTFDLQAYLGLVRDALRGIHARGRRALFVGGTGLYLAALLRGLFDGPETDPRVRARVEASGTTEELWKRLEEVDPESAARIHPNDRRRTVRALEVFEQTGERLSELQARAKEARWEDGAGAREQRARVLGIRWPVDELDERIRARTRAMLEARWADEALALAAAGGLGKSAGQALGYREALALGRGEIGFEEAVEVIALRTRQFARRQRTWFRRFEVRWVEGEAGLDGMVGVG
ncbi:MAG: tRNA (adenosine(37)-N6)-dimethylallyltransferase MiaA, partial [Planctomycetota bacterium]